jgi:hypothetical protein
VTPGFRRTIAYQVIPPLVVAELAHGQPQHIRDSAGLLEESVKTLLFCIMGC